jgi:WD40 repeat protein
MDSHAFSRFWQWVSNITSIQSHSIGSTDVMLPPPPQEINLFYSETKVTLPVVPPTLPPVLVPLPSLHKNETIITSQDNSEQILSSTATDEEKQTSEEIPSAINYASFSPDGKFVVTAGKDGIAWIWETATGGKIRKLHGRNTGELTSAHFSPDSWFVLTTNKFGFVQIWEVVTGKKIRRLSRDFLKITSGMFSPDGKFVVTASLNGTVQIWDTVTGKTVHQFDFPIFVHSVTFSSDVKFVLTTGNDNIARIWDIATGKEVRKFEIAAISVNSAAFSPDGKLIALVSWDSILSIWNATTGKRIRLLVEDFASISVAFSPDRKFLVTAGYDGIARIYNVTEKEVYTLQGHTDEVHSATFSPDGKFLVTASLDGTARIWNLEDIIHPLILLIPPTISVQKQKIKLDNFKKSKIKIDAKIRSPADNATLLTLQDHASLPQPIQEPENNAVPQNKKQNFFVLIIKSLVKFIAVAAKFILRNWIIISCFSFLLGITSIFFIVIWFGVWRIFCSFMLGILSIFMLIIFFGILISLNPDQKNSASSGCLLSLLLMGTVIVLVNLPSHDPYWWWFSFGGLLSLLIISIIGVIMSMGNKVSKR